MAILFTNNNSNRRTGRMMVLIMDRVFIEKYSRIQNAEEKSRYV